MEWSWQPDYWFNQPLTFLYKAMTILCKGEISVQQIMGKLSADRCMC